MGAAAVPAILAGGGALGSFFGRPKVPEPSALETRGFEQQLATSRQQLGVGRDLQRVGIPALGQAAGFFGDLVSGDRGRLNAAVAPESNRIAAGFRGSAANIQQRGRGGTQALAGQLNARDAAAAQGGVVQGVRANAATNLANIGLGASGAARGGGTGSGFVGSSLQTGRIQQAGLQGALSQQSGTDLGGFLFELARNQASKGGGFNVGGGSIEGTAPGRGIPGGVGTPVPIGR